MPFEPIRIYFSHLRSSAGVRQAVARVFRRRLNYGCNNYHTRSSVCAGKLASGFLATFRSRNLLFCPRLISFAAKGPSYAGGFALHRCCLESNLKSSGCLFQVNCSWQFSFKHQLAIRLSVDVVLKTWKQQMSTSENRLPSSAEISGWEVGRPFHDVPPVLTPANNFPCPKAAVTCNFWTR